MVNVNVLAKTKVIKVQPLQNNSYVNVKTFKHVKKFCEFI